MIVKIAKREYLDQSDECSGAVVECSTPDQGIAGLSLTRDTVVCP